MPRSGRARKLIGAFLAVLLAGLAMTVTAAPASAHAIVVSTDPANYRVLDFSPPVVSMQFSEPIEVGLAGLRLIDPQGTDIRIGQLGHANGKSETIAAAVPDVLENGTYTVVWHVVSADTHPVQGAFTFSVGEASASGAPELAGGGADPVLATVYTAVRWVGFAGLALLVGSAFFVAWCWPGAADRRRARLLFWSGWGGLLAATAGTLLLYGPYAVGRSIAAVADPAALGTALGTRMGLMQVLRALLLGVAAAGALWYPRASRRRQDAGAKPPDHRDRIRPAAVVLGFAVALAATWSLATHSAAGAQVALALPIDVVHLVAMAVWLGGLAAVGAALLPSGDLAAMRLALPRFSRTALVCVGLLLATGTYQAWREVGTPSALFGTTYGKVLVGKVVLAAVLVALGAAARRWVRRHYGFAIVTISDKRRARRGPGDAEVTRFRRVVAVEAAIAAVLLGLTAFLVNAEPARAEQASERAAVQGGAAGGPANLAVPFDTGGGPAGRGQLALVLLPGQVGPNEIHLSVLDADGGPKSVAELRVQLSLPDRRIGPLPVPLQYAGAPGHYVGGGVRIPLPGNWELALTVRTSEVDETTVRVPVSVR
ncbi:copper resistance CopC/CopD family protein [Gandjariella thermophila]|uniref:Transport integral membrane protein n=1 Tax=Gandjariella thermophila TaxID=1931992 RepID=A0A4D4JGZ4_9PSEU|nr:copper resistance protein CopC [Gandjariella thermophila]GDY33173.1 transport integral membrane protein [Gandjariella thermophila]